MIHPVVLDVPIGKAVGVPPKLFIGFVVAFAVFRLVHFRQSYHAALEKAVFT